MRTHAHRRSALALLPLAGALATATPSQGPCYGFGSVAVAASVTPSPLPLGCEHAPHWPQWHLLVPPHRAPAPHPGFNPGDARELPCVLVVYRCTGFLLVPVTVQRVRFLGYVLDQPEYACVPPN